MEQLSRALGGWGITVIAAYGIAKYAHLTNLCFQILTYEKRGGRGRDHARVNHTLLNYQLSRTKCMWGK